MLGRPDGTLNLWDLAAEPPTERTVAAHAGPVVALAAPRSEEWLATTGQDRAVRIWDPRTGELRQTFTGHTGWIDALTVDPGGCWLAGAGSTLGTVWVWNLLTSQNCRTMTVPSTWRSSTWTMVTPHDGTWLASGGYSPAVYLWNPNTGELVHTLDGHEQAVPALTTPASGTWLASASFDHTVRIWDPATGTLQHVLTGHDSPIRLLTCAPDGSWLASADQHLIVRIWNPFTGDHLHTLTGHEQAVSDMTSSPDGSLLATIGCDRVVRVSNPTTGTAVCSLRLPLSLSHAAWWQRQKLVIAGGDTAYHIDYQD